MAPGLFYTTLVIHWFIWGFVALDRLVITYVLPAIAQDLRLNYTQSGLLLSVLAITWAVFSYVGGGVSDRVGRKAVIVPSTVLFTLMSWMTGLARSFAPLAVVRAVMGAAEGAYYPAATATIAEVAPQGRRGFAVGAHQSAFPLWGGFLAALYGTQVTAALGWRWVFYLTLIPGLILAALHWRFVREPASTAARLKARREGRERKPEEAAGWFEVFRHRNIVVASLVSICFMTWTFVFLAFGTLYLTNVKQLPLTSAGVVMSAWGLGAFFGMPLLSGLSDLLGRRPVLAGGAILTGLLTFAFTLAKASPWVLFPLMFFVGFFGQGTYPIFTGLIPSESVPPRLAAAAIGLPVAIGEIVGGGILPSVAGYLSDLFGLQVTATIGAVAMVVAGLVGFTIGETAPRAVGPEGRSPAA